MTHPSQHIFANIYARRSVRVYDETRPVSREQIVELLRAAMAAPSACNIQPWEFIVASEKEVLERVIAAAQNGPYNPTAAILVCGSAEFIPWDGDHGVIDCAAAIENMLLAATAMGLGTVWVGGFDSESMAEILDIPEGIIPVGLVYVGYPAESHEPRTRYTEDAVHWNRYDRSIERKPRKGHLFYPDA